MVAQSLESIWETSRTNDWSFALPLILNIGTAVLVAIAFVPVKGLRWMLSAIAIVAMGCFATEYASMEIEEKWRIRSEWVRDHEDSLTENEMSAVSADGANRVLGPLLIGGFSVVTRAAIVLTGLALARLVVSRWLEFDQAKSRTTVSRLEETDPIIVDNPYAPPRTLAHADSDVTEMKSD